VPIPPTGPSDNLGHPLTQAVNDIAGVTTAPSVDWRRVLRDNVAFRRLLVNIAVSSLGDWLGLLAQTALAASLTHTQSDEVFAVGGVLVVRFIPALLLGPLAGAFADRFDRRRTMVVCDVIRFGVFLTIPIVGTLSYLYVASFLVESIGLFWIPAKDASVPNLLPASELESANTLSLMATYGTGAVAAAVFALLSLLTRVLAAGVPFFHTNPVDLSLYFDAATYLYSALTIYLLKQIKGARPKGARAASDGEAGNSFVGSIVEGYRFIGSNRLIRGLSVGILGAFAAAGCVMALGRPYVGLLHAGNAAYGLLFGAVFVGLAGGMALGPRLPAGLSRRRIFGPCIVVAGISLVVVALVPDLVLALLFVTVVTLFAGIAWVGGYTLLGLEVANEVRGRTFGFIQSLVRLDLLAVLAVAPFVAGLIGDHAVRLPNHASVRADGVTIVLLVGGLIAAGSGVFSYRQMDDQRGGPLLRDIWAGLRGRSSVNDYRGTFLAFEGGEGAGKSTQAERLADALRARGYPVVLTREPGDTPVGRRIRALLLEPGTGLAPRAEAMLYAADRAQHVDDVLLPALRQGAVVITDRYVDSSLAYQAGGRRLPLDEVSRLSEVATCGLTPDLTILLDIDPVVGLGRAGGTDRMEREGLDFHRRVREGFLELAAARPTRYVVLDAAADPEEIARRVLSALARVLPPERDRQPETTPA
jgi:dTMP kinase